MAGRAMLPTNMLNAATGAMQSLHDSVLSLEKRRLREKDVAYPVFMAKVPKGKGFVESAIGGMIILRLDDIFAMFNLHPLHYTFVRLFSLYGDADHSRQDPGHRDSRPLLHACQALEQRWGLPSCEFTPRRRHSGKPR